MWSKKWYLKRNISCDVHLLNELLETDVEVECLEMMPSWCGQVNWGNCGIFWVNCAVLCVKDDWKGQFWRMRFACQNCAVYSVFPSGMTSHSKIAQFNWQCTGQFKLSGQACQATPTHLNRLIHTCHAAPMPCRFNSHIPCRAPAILRQCRVLPESPRGSRKYPNC
jgi:hypothetical protein